MILKKAICIINLKICKQTDTYKNEAINYVFA